MQVALTANSPEPAVVWTSHTEELPEDTMDAQYPPFPEPQPQPQQPHSMDPHLPPLPPQQAARANRGVRRLLAAVTVTALAAGVGGAGAGYAFGHGLSGSSTQAASGGSGDSTIASGGNGGTVTIPGSGSGSDTAPWSDGGWGGITVPADPFQGQTTVPQQQSSESSSAASGSQITGLVRIATTMKYAGGEAAGTGMVLTSDGEVVTNHHVVAGATSIKATVMSTGRTYTAQVVGTDTRDDVAVLRLVGASGLDTVTPDTDGAQVGDAVTAVGDANGTVDSLSAATGRIMALGQSITTQDEGSAAGERLTGLIEVSADVISGDSGGATYDDQGEVIGMTTAASSGSTDVVGYAVPIAKVLRIVDDLDSGVQSSRYDYTRPAFLGVGLSDTGTTVVGVFDGGPAAHAGITAGDRITAVGSTQVSTSTELRSAIAALSPGDSVSISWTDTAGSSHEATVTLAKGAVE
jgi:S1-C subfamily serine protease